jgi:zinc transport system permease protein
MSLLHALSFAFIQRAYLAGTVIAALCAMLGLFLVLRRLSLIGDGLSHVSFGAIALGLFFGIYPYYVAVPVVLVASWFILRLTAKARIYGDAAIGIVSALGVSGGVVLASLSGGFNVDLFSYLFGDIMFIGRPEAWLALGLALAVMLIIILYYRELFSVTFDEEYARVTGIRAGRINVLLTLLTALTVVLAVKVVGVMLVSALLVLPATTALQLARGFKRALFYSVAAAVASVLLGITLSLILDLPAGASIVLCGIVLFLLSLALRTLAGR